MKIRRIEYEVGKGTHPRRGRCGVTGYSTNIAGMIHDHFDGSAHCVQCSGECRLDDASMALTAIFRGLFEGEAITRQPIPDFGIQAMRECGIEVDKMRQRAKYAFWSRENSDDLR